MKVSFSKIHEFGRRFPTLDAIVHNEDGSYIASVIFFDNKMSIKWGSDVHSFEDQELEVDDFDGSICFTHNDKKHYVDILIPVFGKYGVLT